jgi:hypothetical protein
VASIGGTHIWKGFTNPNATKASAAISTAFSVAAQNTLITFPDDLSPAQTTAKIRHVAHTLNISGAFLVLALVVAVADQLLMTSQGVWEATQQPDNFIRWLLFLLVYVAMWSALALTISGFILLGGAMRSVSESAGRLAEYGIGVRRCL